MPLSKPAVAVASAGLTALAALMLGAGHQAGQPAQEPGQPAQPAEAQPAPEAKPSTIATYDPQAIFQQSERATQLTEKLMALQGRMQQAQQQGDQATMFQLQQEAQQLQNAEVEAFLAVLDQKLPEVAKEAGVKIVAIDFAYIDESLGEPTDLTDELSEKID